MDFRATDLYNIVTKLNGGFIQPIGETNYDLGARLRQHYIQELADKLISDILDILENPDNTSGSVLEAKEKAAKWIEELKEVLKESDEKRGEKE